MTVHLRFQWTQKTIRIVFIRRNETFYSCLSDVSKLVWTVISFRISLTHVIHHKHTSKALTYIKNFIHLHACNSCIDTLNSAMFFHRTWEIQEMITSSKMTFTQVPQCNLQFANAMSFSSILFLKAFYSDEMITLQALPLPKFSSMRFAVWKRNVNFLQKYPILQFVYRNCIIHKCEGLSNICFCSNYIALHKWICNY